MNSKLLQKVEALQKSISSHGKLNDDVLKKINYKFRLEWNYHSNSMEGNTLTYDETRSIMVGNITVHGKPIKDILDIKGHDSIVSEILKMGAGSLTVSERRLKEIHKAIIYDEIPENQSKIGHWKTEENEVINYKGEKHIFKSYRETADLMHELINWLNSETEKTRNNKKGHLHPIEIAVEFHLRFIDIHPFYDGNGRMVRILVNLILISFGYPPLYIKVDEKDTYSRFLADTINYGGPSNLFFEFIAEKLIRSQQLVLDAINGKEIIEQEDWEKELQILKAESHGKEIFQIAKSKEVTDEVFQKSILPTFTTAFLKLNGFGDLFEIKKWYFLKDDKSFSIHSIDQIASFYQSHFSFDVSELGLQFSFVGRKSAKNPNEGFNIEIKFIFHQFGYEYTPTYAYGPEESISAKNYGEFLSDSEINTIVNSQAKHLLEAIKNQKLKG